MIASCVMEAPLVHADATALRELCQRHRIRKLAVFGSVLRGVAGPDSDVDVLVEFEPGASVGLRFITIQDELSALLGRRVDLNTAGFLSPHFRERVLREAVPLYEAA